MNLIYISKKTKKLKKNEIDKICELKNQHWKFGKKNQINWFKKNIFTDDIHNFILFKSKIIAYTCLRKRYLSFYFKKK